MKVTVPAASRPGTAELQYTVSLQAIQAGLPGVPNPVTSNNTQKTIVTTPAGQVAPPPPAADGTPVAKLFAFVEPAVQGRPIDLDARESFDPDGTITGYDFDFDFDFDGTYEQSSTNGFGQVPDAGAPGTRRVLVRVHDNSGATAVSAPLDLAVVASTTFTEGTFGFPDEVAVNTAFDVSVDNNVSGADVVSLDTDNDGVFDDGLPSSQASPADPKPQFMGCSTPPGAGSACASSGPTTARRTRRRSPPT